jgi:hypothetical protein
MSEQWICKYNKGIDCGTAIPNCYVCGWNPFNVSLKCVRILKVLGVNCYGNTTPANIDSTILDKNFQSGRETR